MQSIRSKIYRHVFKASTVELSVFMIVYAVKPVSKGINHVYLGSTRVNKNIESKSNLLTKCRHNNKTFQNEVHNLCRT